MDESTGKNKKGSNINMAAPKPWEAPIPRSSQLPINSLDGISSISLPTIENSRMQGIAPPPPPRAIQQAMNPYSQMNYYNPFPLSPYQPGGFYNNYRYSPYGPPGNIPSSNFTQMALEESRSAFSSIESVIQTFRSISLVLESTFTSVYSSFRAVTDVLDHFERIRHEIATIYPLVLIWKFLKYLYHRLLRLLHLQRTTPGATEETWSTIYNNLRQSTANVNQQATTSSSSLLVALFFVVSLGTPVLMLKLLSSMIKKKKSVNDSWLEQSSAQSQVIAAYDYSARNPDELSFTRGTTIYLAPYSLQNPTSKWVLGTVDRIHTGLVPVNYIEPVRPPMNSSITLHPQMPFNATSTSPNSSSATTTNMTQTTVQNNETPTLS